MKRSLFLMMLLFIAFASFSQVTHLPAEHRIYLQDSIDNSYYEFSGLARWRNYVLLIPQHRSATDAYQIVGVDTASIDSVLNGKALLATKTITLAFAPGIDTLYSAIKKSIAPRTDFGGIEAAVVVKDIIFFTVETDSLCYVIKGVIDSRNRQVNFSPGDTLSLPKPDYTFGNAGFESIAYLPAQKRLFAVYENNAVTGAPTAFTFDTHLQNRQPAYFTKRMLFRLTDLSFTGGNTLVGINHYYRDYSPAVACGGTTAGANTLKNEYCYYIGNHLAEAQTEMHANPQQTSFTRLLQLRFYNNTIDWETKEIVGYDADNWEGIMPYKNGVLMVVDGRPPGVACKLSFFEWERKKR